MKIHRVVAALVGVWAFSFVTGPRGWIGAGVGVLVGYVVGHRSGRREATFEAAREMARGRATEAFRIMDGGRS